MGMFLYVVILLSESVSEYKVYVEVFVWRKWSIKNLLCYVMWYVVIVWRRFNFSCLYEFCVIKVNVRILNKLLVNDL